MTVALQLGPVWKPVLTAQVLFAPVTEPMITRARRAYFDAINADGAEDDGADLVAQAKRASDGLSAFCRSLILDGAKDWKGVTDVATTKPLAFSADYLAAAIDDPDFGPAMATAYAIPVWLRELEKNASSPSRAGAIAGSKAKKPKAPPSTDSGSATAVPAGKTASPTQTGKAKATRPRPVRSNATPAKPTKAKRSGT